METSPVSVTQRRKKKVIPLALVAFARRDMHIISAHISLARANHTAMFAFKKVGNYNLLIVRELGNATKESYYLTHQEFWKQKPYSMSRAISREQQWFQQGDLFLPHITEL